MTTSEHADLIARTFHESYERLAPQFNYSTRIESAVPWEDVPEPNRSLMLAVASEVAAALASTPSPAQPTEVSIHEGNWGQFAAAVLDAEASHWEAEHEDLTRRYGASGAKKVRAAWKLGASMLARRAESYRTQDVRMAALAPSPVQGADDEREALIAAQVSSVQFIAGDGYPSMGVRTNEEAADIVLGLGFSRRSPSVASSGADDRLAQVEAVIAEIQQKHREKHGVNDHGPYVICDYDKTEWPCQHQQILATYQQSPQAALNEVRAKAWDEGVAAVYGEFYDDVKHPADEHTLSRNPHRAAELRAAPQAGDAS